MTDIPDGIMLEAARVNAEFADSRVTDNLTVIIARALLAAEKRGAERMRQRMMAGMACPPETSGTVTEVAEYEQVRTERAVREEG